jgi:hypothetical protein
VGDQRGQLILQRMMKRKLEALNEAAIKFMEAKKAMLVSVMALFKKLSMIQMQHTTYMVKMKLERNHQDKM